MKPWPVILAAIAAVALVVILWRSRITPLGVTALRPTAPSTRPSDLLAHHDMTTAVGTARALRWSMGSMLQWHVPHPRAGRHLLRSREDLEALWRSHGGEAGAAPAVDFTRSMVVAVFEGEVTVTSAHNVRHVYAGGDRVWVVVGQFSNPWEMINPASVIVVPRADGEVAFLDETDPQAQALQSSQHDSDASHDGG